MKNETTPYKELEEISANKEEVLKAIELLSDFTDNQTIINSNNIESNNLQLKHNEHIAARIEELETNMNSLKKSNLWHSAVTLIISVSLCICFLINLLN